jgi:tetratricopeptide (TPR) repeat protein
MKAIFTFIFLNFFVVITSFAQDYKNLGDNAMNSGNYDQAIEYYQKDYDQNPSDDLTKLINISQKLKKEFSEVDGAISSRNYASAEQHLNNILMIDPNNKFVEQKRQQIKQNQANAKQWKREGRREKFWSGFKGDDDVHEMFGGFHFRLGYSNINTQTFEMIKNDTLNPQVPADFPRNIRKNRCL